MTTNPRDTARATVEEDPFGAPGAHDDLRRMLALADQIDPHTAKEAALRILLRTCGYQPVAIKSALRRLDELMLPVAEVKGELVRGYASESEALVIARDELRRYGS